MFHVILGFVLEKQCVLSRRKWISFLKYYLRLISSFKGLLFYVSSLRMHRTRVPPGIYGVEQTHYTARQVILQCVKSQTQDGTRVTVFHELPFAHNRQEFLPASIQLRAYSNSRNSDMHKLD